MAHKTILIIAGIVLVLVIVVAIVASIFMAKRPGPVNLTYWGLWEDEGVMNEVIAGYEKTHPNVKITYVKESPLHYRGRMTEAISNETGPDIVRIHNSWLPMMVNYLAPVPDMIMSASNFESSFYPVAARDLMAGGKVYAIPLEIDTLVLFINQDLFNKAGVNIPTTWDGPGGFREAASVLTVRGANGRIQTAGAALGAVSNVDHWEDIVGLMMRQAQIDLDSPASGGEFALDSARAEETLSYYTTFQSVDRVWDETLDRSTLAFGSGKLAMYFGPSWRYFDFENFKNNSNPNLNFKVVPVPQLSSAKEPVNYANYWAEAVSKKSKNPEAAFEFLKYLSSQEQLEKLYTAQSNLRSFGEPYSRVEMGSSLVQDARVAPVVSQAPTATSWYLASYTADEDSGINSRISYYFENAINGAIKSGRADLKTVAEGVTQVFSDYGL